MNKVPLAVKKLLEMSSFEIEDIDYFVFHQASQIALTNIRRALDIPEAKFIEFFSEIGNTVSSTIPIALKNATLKKSCGTTNVLLMGFGVGYSIAGCILEF
jgi:3-oxoacyl-[acyl-carrier-protein] synthase-3